AQDETVPTRMGLLVDRDVAGHPQVQAELGPVAVRLGPDELAPPVDAGQPPARQGVGDLARRVRPGDVGVGVVDLDDPAAHHCLDRAPRALRLGELWHYPYVGFRPSSS